MGTKTLEAAARRLYGAFPHWPSKAIYEAATRELVERLSAAPPSEAAMVEAFHEILTTWKCPPPIEVVLEEIDRHERAAEHVRRRLAEIARTPRQQGGADR